MMIAKKVAYVWIWGAGKLQQNSNSEKVDPNAIASKAFFIGINLIP